MLAIVHTKGWKEKDRLSVNMLITYQVLKQTVDDTLCIKFNIVTHDGHNFAIILT